MRSGAIALCGTFVMLTLPAFAQSTPTDFNAQIEQCVRQNAPKVEAAIPDLKQGVDFLLSEVCAVPISAESERQSKEQTAITNAHWQKMCDEEKHSKDDNKQVPASMQDYGCTMAKVTRVGIVNSDQYMQEEVGVAFGGQASPTMTALAATTLLDLRLAHQKSEAPH